MRKSSKELRQPLLATHLLAAVRIVNIKLSKKTKYEKVILLGISWCNI